MTRMLPSTIGAESPPGEHDLFNALRDAPGTDNWVAFHSLNIAQHATQVEGEADFVVLVPGHGVLIIEVKSHERVEADGEGRWKLGNNDWQTKSPFDQASGAMHSILDYLSSRGHEPIGYPVWYAVWFTSVARSRMPDSIGWQQLALLDASDLHSADVGAPIIRVLAKASEHLAESARGYRRVAGTPFDTHIERMQQLLEPRFVTTITAGEAERRRVAELDRFTAEQARILDVVGANPRIMLDGPAGSGKTYIAIEAARRAVAEGKRVLVIVFNRLIEGELKAQCEGADAYRIHALMAEVADRGSGGRRCQDVLAGGNANREWYDHTLPDLALDAALGGTQQYDYLVVDEAQDLAQAHYLDFLDLLLVGGLAGVPMFVTGDFAHQAIYASPHAEPARDIAVPATKQALVDRLPGLMQLSLTTNVRSTPEVGRFVAELIGDDSLYTEHRRSDDDIVSVEKLAYSSPERQDELLAAAVDRILSEPFTVRDIVILSPVRDSAAANAADARLKSRLGKHVTDTTGIRWGTIHEFKGMEAPAVILTDIDHGNRHVANLLYVGASRATDRLVVLNRTPSR